MLFGFVLGLQKRGRWSSILVFQRGRLCVGFEVCLWEFVDTVLWVFQEVILDVVSIDTVQITLGLEDWFGFMAGLS